jgi:hypothetical protein
MHSSPPFVLHARPISSFLNNKLTLSEISMIKMNQSTHTDNIIRLLKQHKPYSKPRGIRFKALSKLAERMCKLSVPLRPLSLRGKSPGKGTGGGVSKIICSESSGKQKRSQNVCRGQNPVWLYRRQSRDSDACFLSALCCSTAPWTLDDFFSFLILYAVGRTPWTVDQSIVRLLPTHRT